MASNSRYLRDGIIAGLIGAALVAVWFLIYDAASGRPFRTPSLLGAATFEGVKDPATVPTAAHLVVQYTVLHGVVFALIGVLVAYLIVSAQREPSRLLMLVIALLCFEVFFLAVVTTLAHPVLDEVAWWAILTANAVAAGVPLRTPALLGAALFHGLREPSALAITVPLVLEYTVVHGAAFILFGLAAAGLLALADREPRLLFAFVMLFCCFEVFFATLVVAFAEWLFEAVPWWTILAGNLLAALVMMGYFFRGHRVAWSEFLHARR